MIFNKPQYEKNEFKAKALCTKYYVTIWMVEVEELNVELQYK